MDKLLHLLLLVALFSVGRAANCGLPGLPVGGLINSISDWPDDVNFSPGTQVGYSCAGDDQRVFGENLRQCTADGQWTGSPPLCLTNVVLKRPVTVEIHSSHKKRPVTYDIPELTDGVVNFTENSPCLYVSSNELHVFNFHKIEGYVVHQLWIHTNKPFSLNDDWELKIPQNWSYKVTTKTSSPSIVVTNDDMQMTDELSVGIVSHKSLEVCELELYAHRIEHGCGRPDAPANGRVSIETNVATYSCDIGYRIDGPTQRTCNGVHWTGNAPICVPQEPTDPTVHIQHTTVSLPEISVKKQFEINAPTVKQECVKPDAPANGRVSVDTNVATYSCDIGYQIDGPIQRTCCGGQWTEKAPVCIAQEPKGPTKQPVTNGVPTSLESTSSALMISLLVVLLVILLVALGFCICCYLKMKEKPEHVYEELFRA